MRATSFLLYLALAAAATAGTITLSTDIELPAYYPDPNEEITVFIHSDAPVLFMDLLIRVNGDATVEGVMDETTCAPYGWDANSIVTCTVNPDNSIQLFALNFNQNTSETVGYLQFRCNSSFVAVYLDTEQSKTVGWTDEFVCSAEPISVGTLTLPPLIERNEPTFASNHCPAVGVSDNDPCTWGWGPGDWQPSAITTLAQSSEKIWGNDLPPLPVIEINSDITENQVWTPDHYYLVTSVVDVQALLVIEPGTHVFFDGTSMVVNDGGTLISSGTPDNPIVYTTSQRFTEVGWYWTIVEPLGLDYYCPIIVQSTASTATRITYSYIEASIYGIITDNIRLSTPIENNWICGTRYGVYEIGPKLTDVRNNLFWYSGFASVEVYPTIDPNVPADTEHVLKIENNTCDYLAVDGIFVMGVEDPNHIPKVYIANNIISRCWHDGIVLYGGWLNSLVTNNGYYNNVQNKNWDFQEFSPAEINFRESPSPFEDPIGEKFYQHHWLVPDCNFIDAGSDYITQTPLVGKTTSMDSTPDTGMIDIGFHMMDWTYTGAGTVVGTTLDDITTCAEYWLSYSPFDPNGPGYIDPALYIFDPNHPENWIDPNSVTFGGDWDNNGFVNLHDVALLSQQWQAAPAVPDLAPVIDGNPDEGWISIAAGQPNPDTVFVYAYVNGKYINQVYAMGSDTPKYYDLTESGDGPHEIKFVAMDGDGNLSHSEPFVYEPNEPLPLKYCIVPSTYEPNEPVPFDFCNPEGGDVTVSVYGNGGELAWSQVITGEPNDAQVPADAISQLLTIDSIEFTAAGRQPAIIKPFPIKELPSDVDREKRALMVCPDTLLNRYDPRVKWQVLKSFIDQGVKVLTLDESQATWENVAKYGQHRFIKYVYFMGHGDYRLEADGKTFYRTSNKLFGDLVLSCKYSEFPDGQAPSWCKPLPEYLEKYTKTWASMNFDRLRFFYSDSCYGGRLKIDGTGTLVERQSGQQGLVHDAGSHSDISLALRLDNDYESRAYHGYWDKGVVDLYYQTSYQKWTKNIWSKLGNWQDLNDAMLYAIDQAVRDGDANDPNSALNNYRLFGQGDISTIRLNSR